MGEPELETPGLGGGDASVIFKAGPGGWRPGPALKFKGKSVMRSPQEQYVFDKNGKKKAVILTIKRYEKLLEDLHDMTLVAERREEGTISLKGMKRTFKSDGLL